MSFPACKHRKASHTVAAREDAAWVGCMRWMAAEPFRLFFASGVLWSIAGVSLWPLFFAGKLGFYPGISHAHLMIQAFGGAFVAGFLGTAGPRMATAPKITPLELAVMFSLHVASGVCHLLLRTQAGDALFLMLLVVLLTSLGVRTALFRKDWPPPQMLLALTGLLCGIAGTALWLSPHALMDLRVHRLASLLLYQGLLLPPVLGIGSFLFPRILGGSFGEPVSREDRCCRLIRAITAALLLVVSFPLEAWDWTTSGGLLRAGTALAYLLIEVRWHRKADEPPRGSLAGGLNLALVMGFCGLTLAAVMPQRSIAAGHLLYAGGFGLLMLVVASRVLFGHSGQLAGFARRSWFVRIMLTLVVLASTTRAAADFFPQTMIAHYQYAAWIWASAALLWFAWHGRRFLLREEE